ncbi:MAG: hypothetical protein AAGJ94_03145 [Pseudomonadota bacterium]
MDHRETLTRGRPAPLDFPAAKIRASAGELEAITALFQDIEHGRGIAFVLVLKLDPHHESLMGE